MTSRGKFIVFEGIDGSGKTTCIEQISSRMHAAALSTFAPEKEPSSSHLGSFIRNDALSKWGKLRKTLPAEAYQTYVQLLMLADRIEHYLVWMEPKLKQGKHVLCDRFSWSTYAYSLSESVLQRTFFGFIDSEILKCSPDLVVYFKLPVETALARLDQRMLTALETKATLERAAKVYDELALSKFMAQEVVVIDAESPLDLVVDEVWKQVERVTAPVQSTLA